MQVPLPLMEEISRCPAEEQATLAALLSTLHFSKVYRFPFPTAEYVAQLVENSRSQLLIAPPQERLRVIVSELTSRLRLPPHTEPDELSKWLLWKAADRFRLAREQPPLTLAREVLQLAIVEILKNYLEAYEKADENTRQQMRRQMEEVLTRAPSQVAEALRRTVGAETMTSEMLVRLMKQVVASGGTILFVNSLGFSAYIALSTIIHTIFTTLLGITLPFAVYTTASTVLSMLTGPVGWLLLGAVFAGMIVSQGSKLNNELIYMVALTALIQWYSHFQQAEENQQIRAAVFSDRQEPLPPAIAEQTTQLRLLTDNLLKAQQEGERLQKQIETILRTALREEQAASAAVRRANEQKLRVQSLEKLVQLTAQRRESLQKELLQAGSEELLLAQRLRFAEEELRSLQQELAASVQYAEEAEKARSQAEESFQRVLEESKKAIRELQQQRAQSEQEQSTLRQQIAQVKAKRKQDYAQRLAGLMPYIQFHERAIEWFADQTDENLLLSAERVLLDLNYSAYPKSGWKRVYSAEFLETEFEEIHFAKDYRIYFALEGNIKKVMLIGHKDSQAHDIAWLLQNSSLPRRPVIRSLPPKTFL